MAAPTMTSPVPISKVLAVTRFKRRAKVNTGSAGARAGIRTIRARTVCRVDGDACFVFDVLLVVGIVDVESRFAIARVFLAPGHLAGTLAAHAAHHLAILVDDAAGTAVVASRGQDDALIVAAVVILGQRM